MFLSVFFPIWRVPNEIKKKAPMIIFQSLRRVFDARRPSVLRPPFQRRPSYGFGDLDGPADATHQALKWCLRFFLHRVFSVDWQGFFKITPRKKPNFLKIPWFQVGFLNRKGSKDRPTFIGNGGIASKEGGSYVEWNLRASKMPNSWEWNLRISPQYRWWNQLSGECLSFMVSVFEGMTSWFESLEPYSDSGRWTIYQLGLGTFFS